jgi:tRNA A-37 threonylcarbamoyl transferase component Bud32
VAERKKAYAIWKQEYMAMVGNDPVAFRAALCMGRQPARPSKVPSSLISKKKPDIKGLVEKYMVGLRQRLHDNRVFYVKECNIRPGTIEFFNQLIPTNYVGTTLSTCEVVGLAMLRRCVPASEVRFYTFKQVLGTGLHGFVFQCLYKGKEERAIKLVVLHKGGDQNAYSIPVENGKEIFSVSKASLEKEFKMHQHMLRLSEKSDRFRVLNILSGLCVFKPPRFDNCIGVYIMESLKPKPFEKELDAALLVHADTGAFPRLIREKVKEVPRVMAELHRLGVAHSDMHAGNVAFDPKNPRRPYVLDFGRMHMLSKLGEQAQLYRILEYAAPLDTYLRWFGKSYPEETVELYNTYLEGVDLSESDKTYVQKNRLQYIFQPIDVKDLKKRIRSINDLMSGSTLFQFKGLKYPYYDVTELLI